MAKIIGNTTATPNPRPDWNQTDETKADYIKNKPPAGKIFTTEVNDDILVLKHNETICEKGDKGDPGYVPIVQTIGDSENTVMSQRAVTELAKAEEARAVARENEIEHLFVAPTQEAVNEWLAEHPEATTTVQDGSLTEKKFTDELKHRTIKDYVTPEMYGAKGDGKADDTEAIKAALESRKTVVGFGTYKIKSTQYVFADVYLRSVIYEGAENSFAFEIRQTSSVIQDITLDIRTINSTGGGIGVINVSNEMLRFVTVKVGSIYSVYHGISYEAHGTSDVKGENARYVSGIQYCNVYIDGIVYTTKGNCLNFYVASNTINSVWVGEIKVYGGQLSASGTNTWAVFCDGYSASENKLITAVRLIGCSLEQCTNGIYLHEASSVSLVASRTEVIKRNWSENVEEKGVEFSGCCDKILFDGFSIRIEDIDLSKIDKRYGTPPLIEFREITRGTTPLGSAFVGADYRLKIRPYGRVNQSSKKLGTAETPAKIEEYTPMMPRSIRLYGGSYTEIDSSFDFFGECKLIVEVASTGGAHLFYRMPVTNELMEIVNIREVGFYQLENYFATLDDVPTSLWRIHKLPHAQGTTGLAVDKSVLTLV
jgi:hypothetical protein